MLSPDFRGALSDGDVQRRKCSDIYRRAPKAAHQPSGRPTLNASGNSTPTGRTISPISHPEAGFCFSYRLKGQVLASELSAAELRTIFEVQYNRRWHIDISQRLSKAHFLRYVGRYIRRPPVAQHRLDRFTDKDVEYLAKDTRNHNQLVRVRYSNEEFVAILKEQVPDRGRHAMRYFGLLAPRSKACTWAAVFVLLGSASRCF